MGFFTDILGTLRTTFKIGKATVSTTGLTAARTITVQDLAGTLSLESQYRVVKSGAIAEGATTPNPGGLCWAWSTTLGSMIFWNGSKWQAMQPSVPTAEVDWYFPSKAVNEFYSSGNINFAHASFNATVDTDLVPTAGQTLYLQSWGTPTLEGVYVLGSVATLSAVPITRHPDWPSTRSIPTGTRIISRRLPDPHQTWYLGFEYLLAANVSVANDTLDVVDLTGPVRAGSNVVFSNLQSGAVMPGGLSLGVAYFVVGAPTEAPAGGSRLQLATTPGGTAVNITSTGTEASGRICDITTKPSYSSKFLVDIELHGAGATWGAQVNPMRAFHGEVATFGVSDTAYQPPFKSNDEGSITDTGLAIGSGAKSRGNGIAISGGSLVASAADYGLAVGLSTQAATQGIAVGGYASAAKEGAALGYGASAVASRSLALGYGANSSLLGEIAFLRNSCLFEDGLGYSASLAETDRKIIDLRAASNTSTEVQLTEGGLGGGTAYTSIPIPLRADESVRIKGTLHAGTVLDSSKRAVWDVDVVVSSDLTTSSVRNLSRLLGAKGSIGPWKWRITTDAMVFNDSGIRFLVMGESGVQIFWSLNVDVFSFRSFDYGASPIGAIETSRSDNVIEVPASEGLIAGNLVSLWDSSGAKVRKADANPTQPADGFVLADYASSDVARVYLSGENPLLSGLTVGPLYLSTTAGGVTSTAPGTGNLVQRVGFALSATKMLFQRETPIQT